MLEKFALSIGNVNGQIVDIPYRYLTRHGLIAGSTGTGKSRAMQVLAEQLADDGITVFVSDVKGDASGFCVAGDISANLDKNESDVDSREQNKSAPFSPHKIKTNYWSVSDRFIHFRLSIRDVGSILISRLLFLNQTQESHLSLAFAYARNMRKPIDTTGQLLDTLDEMVKTGQRGISQSSVMVIQRKILALEELGLGKMFGTPNLQLADLSGLNVLNLSDTRKDMNVSIAPAFLLQMLFDSLPEVGDLVKPKFVIFFDEAHYLFKDSNKTLRDLMVNILKQIRSKGVAVFFVTQDVGDLPDEILSQLSTKIIFSQKVFTEKGISRLRALAKSFPTQDSFGEQTQGTDELMEMLKTMPPGLAVISTLDKNGNQTPPMKVRIFAPATSMRVVSDKVLREETNSGLITKYAINKTTGSKVASKPPEIKSTVIIPKQSKPEKHLPPGKPGELSRAFESVLDLIFKFLLKFLEFLIRVLSLIINALIWKPLVRLFKYLTKKPIRLVWFMILMILIAIVVLNWSLLLSSVNHLKLS